MTRFSIIIVWCLIIVSCTPYKAGRIDDKKVIHDYSSNVSQRSGQFRSAAYLIDLRINDDGKKFSVTTEVYFSGDSVGFYGRGYVGKGAFKGNVINDVVTVYFSSENEYFSGQLAELNSGSECSSPGEVLLYVLSLLSGRIDTYEVDDFAVFYDNPWRLKYQDGRFDRTILLNKRRLPKKEKLIDSNCGDSIVVNYGSHSTKYPFYKTNDILYYNDNYNFRARGFVREQQYNIQLKKRKFEVVFPASARRIESI
ncbi:MAG: hypothetical protein V3V99_03370 [candidate division Zixibacteria bacterium]